MTISTPPINPSRRAARRFGFTLVEVMVSATISTVILAGVLTAFVYIGRSGFAASSYAEMEGQTRTALQIFGDDVRKATDIRTNNTRSITLWVATATSGTTLVTYAYDTDAASTTYQCFYRLVGDATSTLPRRVLIRNVASDFAIQRYKLEQSGVTDNTASNDRETKQIEVTLRATRTGTTVVAANQSALSARYILRNKRVSN
jgi:prepilin-type N-terminal cleavage/methylation domain-containing protein